ncbi:MAG: nucleotidyltransferase family protein [Oscillospiraceae bacterium]|nr:nucleotidyltransferase family protein [Oscillospiraceae bacterium]
MNKTAEDVIYLAACAVNDRAPEKKRVESMDLEAVHRLASRHLINAAVSYALVSAGYKDKISDSAIAAAIRKTALFDKAWSRIRSSLEGAGIWYMPLKGAVLKNLYPKYGMREFADHDILFDASRADDVKAVMEDMGFTANKFGAGVHDVYFKKPSLNFEMHRALFGMSHDRALYEYYDHVESRLKKDRGYAQYFTPEDFYLYMTAHEYKHYTVAGTGLRSLLDTYVYLKAQPLDTEYTAAESEKIGIRDFEEKNRSLSLHLFSGETLTPDDREMLDYILSSGTYGTIQHSVENKIHRNKYSKLGYMLDRFSVPVSRKDPRYISFAAMYPLFYKHKILLPLLPFYRIFRAVRSGRFKKEAKVLREAKR